MSEEKNNNLLLKDIGKIKYLDPLQNIYDIDELVYERKESINLIKQEITPLGQTHNLYVFGIKGSGKTTLVRREVNKMPGDNIIVYINCKLHDNVKKIYDLINYQFKTKEPSFFLNNQFRITEQKLEGYELMKFFVLNIKKPIFLVIDEFEYIVLKKDVASKNFPYRLLRISEEIEKIRSTDYQYTLIFMTNKMGLKKELAPDVRSSTNPVIVLPAYDAPDIYQIIKRRVDYCLKPGTINDDVLRLISKIAKQEYNSDARSAINLLSRGLRIANHKKQKEISRETVYEAHNRIREDELDRELEAMDDQAIYFLYSVILLVEEQKGITEFIFQNAANKYDAFSKKISNPDKVGWKQLTNYLYDHLVTYGLVGTSTEKEGKHKIFRFTEDVNSIKKKIIPRIPQK